MNENFQLSRSKREGKYCGCVNGKHVRLHDAPTHISTKFAKSILEQREKVTSAS
jgi:hypothetical protein